MSQPLNYTQILDALREGSHLVDFGQPPEATRFEVYHSIEKSEVAEPTDALKASVTEGVERCDTAVPGSVSAYRKAHDKAIKPNQFINELAEDARCSQFWPYVPEMVKKAFQLDQIEEAPHSREAQAALLEDIKQGGRIVVRCDDQTAVLLTGTTRCQPIDFSLAESIEGKEGVVIKPGENSYEIIADPQDAIQGLLNRIKSGETVRLFHADRTAFAFSSIHRNVERVDYDTAQHLRGRTNVGTKETPESVEFVYLVPSLQDVPGPNTYIPHLHEQGFVDEVRRRYAADYGQFMPPTIPRIIQTIREIATKCGQK